jgi:hypothetical protein
MSNIEKYNTKLSQLAGLATAFASEIENDENLKLGEKFLLIQRFFDEGISKIEKTWKSVEKQIDEWAKQNSADNGNGVSQEIEFEGASVHVKYTYVKPTLDSEKLKTELERAYSEIGVVFDETQFLKLSKPREKVIKQSII